MKPFLNILALSFLLGLLLPADAALLSELWPEYREHGTFDELGLAFRASDRLVLMPGSTWCIVDGQMLRLPRAPRRVGKDLEIPDELGSLLNKRELAATWKSEAALPSANPPVVVIDAGHGGKDSGAIGMGGLYEKDVTLDLACRVLNYIKDKPIKVTLTRSSDVFVELAERCAVSNRAKATVFVSIHCNSVDSSFPAGRSKTGFQLYRMNGHESSVQKRADSVRRSFPLPDYTPTPFRGAGQPFLGHENLFRWKDRESLRLAEALAKAFGFSATAGNNLFERNFSVLRETLAPSILVEIDFISNPRTEVLMGLQSWRDDIARKTAEGILSYLGLQPLG